jgi:hypothetical protein
LPRLQRVAGHRAKVAAQPVVAGKVALLSQVGLRSDETGKKAAGWSGAAVGTRAAAALPLRCRCSCVAGQGPGRTCNAITSSPNVPCFSARSPNSCTCAPLRRRRATRVLYW